MHRLVGKGARQRMGHGIESRLRTALLLPLNQQKESVVPEEKERQQQQQDKKVCLESISSTHTAEKEKTKLLPSTRVTGLGEFSPIG
jgi:hypothetical protein